VHADITRLDLAARRRSLSGYALGLAAYALVVVALYPAFKNTSSLNKLIQADPTAAALFGVTGSISSSGGWLDGNLYANFFPLILLLLTVGYGAASLAGQDEDGTLCLLAVLPVRSKKNSSSTPRPPTSAGPGWITSLTPQPWIATSSAHYGSPPGSARRSSMR
jgi:ABC-2 type transport system permease protein